MVGARGQDAGAALKPSTTGLIFDASSPGYTTSSRQPSRLSRLGFGLPPTTPHQRLQCRLWTLRLQRQERRARAAKGAAKGAARPPPVENLFLCFVISLVCFSFAGAAGNVKPIKTIFSVYASLEYRWWKELVAWKAGEMGYLSQGIGYYDSRQNHLWASVFDAFHAMSHSQPDCFKQWPVPTITPRLGVGAVSQ